MPAEPPTFLIVSLISCLESQLLGNKLPPLKAHNDTTEGNCKSTGRRSLNAVTLVPRHLQVLALAHALTTSTPLALVSPKHLLTHVYKPKPDLRLIYPLVVRWPAAPRQSSGLHPVRPVSCCPQILGP